MDPLSQLSEETQKNVQAWLSGPFDLDTKNAIKDMISSNLEDVENSFYQHLSFGTAGLRGIMGPGPNRMNVYTVRQTTKGLADYLKEQFPSSPIKVAVAYDSRHNSQLFATESARVLASASIEVYLFKELRPTPLLSFACRHLKCNAAIMITASHNPPEYNGYKVYWSDGGQILSPHDKGITEKIEQAREGGRISITEPEDPYIHIIGKEIDEAYLETIRPLSLWSEPDKSSLKVHFSPLHGTGATLMPQALQDRGITTFSMVESQSTPDGNFPEASSPNPEVQETLQTGINEMIEGNLDLFLATDPDADRLGVVVNHQGTPHILTGNQIAALSTEWIFHQLSSKGTLPPKPAVVKSIVTTPLVQKITEAYGGKCHNVLTGFKYIAKQILDWETGSDSENFVFGCEESYGYLFGSYARDKDAIGTGCLIAEIAWQMKQESKTLIDGLNDIWKQHGFYNETVINCAFGETKAGRERMAALMEKLRSSPPKKFASYNCIAVEDMKTKQFTGDPSLQLGNDLPDADAIIFTLEDLSLVIFRPSGTEPKVKVYLMLAPPQSKGLEKAQEESHAKAEQLRAYIRKLT